MKKKVNILFYSWGTTSNYIPSSEFYSIINRLKDIVQNKIIIDSVDYSYNEFSKEEFVFYYENIDLFIDKYLDDILQENTFKIDYFVVNNLRFNETVPEVLLIAKALKKKYGTVVIMVSEFAKYYWDYLRKFYSEELDYLVDWWDARAVAEEKVYSIIMQDKSLFDNYLNNLDEVNWYNQSPDYSSVYGKTDILEFEISRWCRTFPRCFYCWASYVKSFHSRSILENKRLLDEFRDNWIKKIYFACNEINFDNEYLESFLDMMIENWYGFKWSCYLLAKDVSDDLVKKMYLAWCRHIKIWIESVSPKRMMKISKRLNLEELERIMRCIHNQWIILQGHFLYNFKDETVDELKDLMLFIEKNNEYLDLVDFYYLKYKPRSIDYKDIFKFHYPKFWVNENENIVISKFDLPFIKDNLYVDINWKLKRAFIDEDKLFLRKAELLSKFLIKIWKQKKDFKLWSDPKTFFINY